MLILTGALRGGARVQERDFADGRPVLARFWVLSGGMLAGFRFGRVGSALGLLRG